MRDDNTWTATGGLTWPWWAIPMPMLDPHMTPEDQNTFVVELDQDDVKDLVGLTDMPLEQCRKAAWKIHNEILHRDRVANGGTDLQRTEIRRLEEKLRECIPCQSCGADPRISPPSGQELPIVKGALDEQAKAETQAFDAEARARSAERRVEALRGQVERLENEIRLERLCTESATQQLLDVQQDCIAAVKRLAEAGVTDPYTEDSIRRDERRRAEAEIGALIREHATPDQGSSASRINPGNGDTLANLVAHSDYRKEPR